MQKLPSVNMESVKTLLHAELPELSVETESYVKGILETSGDDFENDEDLFDTLNPVLIDYMAGKSGSSGDDNEEPLRDLCMRIFRLLRADSAGSKSGASTGGMEKLKFGAPVSLHEMLPQTRTLLEDQSENSSSLWMKKDASRKTLVDQRKLANAEAKIKAKQIDRINDFDPTTGSALSSQRVIDKEVSTSQSVSKRQPENTLDVVIDNFDMSFQDRKLLENAALQLIYGRRYGVVGRNGVGKSTLLRMLALRELSVPKQMTILFVEQEVKAEDITAVESVLKSDTVREDLLEQEKLLKSKLQQEDVAAALNAAGVVAATASTTSQQLAKIYDQLQAIEADKAPARAAGILAGLGFTPTMQLQATKTFSGGWRMRLALARALFAKPDLLLLDEPTNYLDLRTIMWLEDYLQTWKSTILLVSHDRNFLRTVTTDILHFSRKALTSYRGDFDTFMRVKDERLVQQQRLYEAQQREIEHVQEFINRFRYNAKRASLVQSKIKLLERMPKVEAVLDEGIIKFKFPSVEKSSSCAFKFDDVTFQYTTAAGSSAVVPQAAAAPTPGASTTGLQQGLSSQRKIFDKISTSANADSRIVIVGENGSGKSTLLKLILGRLEASKGFVTTDRRLRIGYFAQHHVDMLDLTKSPLQFIEIQNPGHREADYRAVLGSFSVQSELQTQPLSTLSGGEKTRVALALMAFKKPNLLIFDEVSNHLDVETVEALAEALTHFTGGVLLVSHDEYLIELVCKELWLCAGGKVVPVPGGFEEYKKVVRRELEQLKMH